jgi:predicted Zn-dependent protease
VKFDARLPADGVNVTPTHPLEELGVLLGGLLGVVVALVLAATLAIDHLVPMLPADLEARLFGHLGSADQADDPRSQAVQALLERLAAHWPERPYAFRVEVLDETEPNALAFPGGLVLVTSGLLEACDSENELAFVLGHELGHFAGRDHLRGIGRGLAFVLVLGALGAADAGSASGLAALAGDIAGRGHDRAQEVRADAFGIGLVQAEYGHLAGSTGFFEKLPEPENAVARSVAHYLSTHPMGDERIATLRELADERGWTFQGDLTPFSTASR